LPPADKVKEVIEGRTAANAFFSCLLHLLLPNLNLFALCRYCFAFKREDNVSMTTLSRYFWVKIQS
ncbi:MAG TPA: hypothetical protein VI728_13780, partial [Syntrophales bacterium]|nr:hypothetical protein [Syntrophales bacterium]